MRSGVLYVICTTLARKMLEEMMIDSVRAFSPGDGRAGRAVTCAPEFWDIDMVDQLDQ
jgi:hypothetical protein